MNKDKTKPEQLTEERVREIVRDEVTRLRVKEAERMADMGWGLSTKQDRTPQTRNGACQVDPIIRTAVRLK